MSLADKIINRHTNKDIIYAEDVKQALNKFLEWNRTWHHQTETKEKEKEIFGEELLK